MDIKHYRKKFKENNLRLTKSREAMIEVLDNQHLTFKDIQRGLAKFL